MGEYHIVIIWNRGYQQSERILLSLRESFSMIFTAEVSWPQETFPDRLIAFYDNRDVRRYLKGKLERIGIGPFRVVLLSDPSPKYEIRETTHGPDQVNINLFDLKQLFREWIGHNALHASDSQNEALKALRLLEADLLSVLNSKEQDLLSTIVSRSAALED